MTTRVQKEEEFEKLWELSQQTDKCPLETINKLKNSESIMATIKTWNDTLLSGDLGFIEKVWLEEGIPKLIIDAIEEYSEALNRPN